MRCASFKLHLVVVCLVVAGCNRYPAYKNLTEAQAEAELVKLGVAVTPDPKSGWEIDAGDLAEDDLAKLVAILKSVPKIHSLNVPQQIDDKQFHLLLSDHPEIAKLRFHEVQGLSDKGIGSLSQLHGLTDLAIWGPCSFSPDSLAVLKSQVKLENLTIQGSVRPGSEAFVLRDAQATFLTELRQLKILNLESNQLTDRTLEIIGTLTLLQALTLEGNQEITDEGLAGLRHLTGLFVLNLSETSIHGDGLKHLVKNPVHNLMLEDIHLSPAGCEVIPQFSKLGILNLDGRFIDDESQLESWKGLRQLRMIYFRTSVSPQIKARIQELLPEVKISEA